MNKVSKLLSKVNAFAKAAEKDSNQYMQSFAEHFTKESQADFLEDKSITERSHLLEPRMLFKYVSNIKSNLLEAVGDVRSISQKLKDEGLVYEDPNQNKDKHEFVSSTARNFIMSAYKVFPDLDGAVQAQDPRQLNVFGLQVCVANLENVIRSASKFKDVDVSSIVSDLQKQLSSAKANLSQIEAFQKAKSKWKSTDISEKNQMMTGIKQKEFDDLLKDTATDVVDPWKSKTPKVNPPGKANVPNPSGTSVPRTPNLS